MRIAIIGAGEMGATHAAAYSGFGRAEGVEIAAVVSRSAARARRLGRRVKVAALTDAGRVLRDDTIEAVDVVVPSGHHRRFVVAALRQGKHVFTETPMALTLADADAMIAAARANRRTLMVAQVMRFVADDVRIHKEATSGALGRPRLVVARRLSRPYWTRRPRPFSDYGEPLVELSVHDFDLANWILGRPRAVVATGTAGKSGAVEHAFAMVEYRGGSALVEGSAMMPEGFPFTTALRVQCDHGALDHQGEFLGGPEPTNRFVRYGKTGREVLRVRGYDPYEAECRHFVRSVRGRADPGVLSALSDRESLRVALAAKRSIQTGRRVVLA